MYRCVAYTYFTSLEKVQIQIVSNIFTPISQYSFGLTGPNPCIQKAKSGGKMLNKLNKSIIYDHLHLKEFNSMVQYYGTYLCGVQVL